jgi:hypothetical protein
VTGEGVWLASDEELAEMTGEELAEYCELLEAAGAAPERWEAQPKQALATRLAARAVETLYGGAAGGGKSEWLLHHALDQMLAHPFNRGIIFRRVYPSLEETLIPRSKRVYPHHGGMWNGQQRTWTFPNGSVLVFGSMENKDSFMKYQGAEYGFMAFEEVTEFEEGQYTEMLVRLRAPGPGIRAQVCCTTNPGGKGHRWVKRRWVKPKAGVDYDGPAPLLYEVWQPKPTEANPRPLTRVFVPATLADNPRLTARDPEYVHKIRALRATDPARAEALEHGDWDAIDAVVGAMVRQSDLNDGRVDPRHPERLGVLERVVALDPSDGNEDGKGDSFGVCVASRGLDGCGYVEYSGGWRADPLAMAKRIVALYHKVGADALVIEKNHGGRWLPLALRQVDPYLNIVTVWASEGKRTRAQPVAALFAPVEGVDPALRHRARMAGEHEELEAQWTTFTGAPDEDSPNELDACVWALHRLLLKGRAGGSDSYRDERLRGRR